MKKDNSKILKSTLMVMTLSLFVFVAEGQAQLLQRLSSHISAGRVFKNLLTPVRGAEPLIPIRGLAEPLIPQLPLYGKSVGTLQENTIGGLEGVVDLRRQLRQLEEVRAQNAISLATVTQEKEQQRAEVARLQEELKQVRAKSDAQVTQEKEQKRAEVARLQQQVEEERGSQVARTNRFKMLGCKLATMLGISKVANMELRKQINEMELQNDDMQSKISKVVRIAWEEVSRLEGIIAEKDAQISQLREGGGIEDREKKK
ncbi:MAG: hypothetical protein LBT58_05230 [Endomicrobium sp.]|jgi:hypothetical protein|nr:hypothetical protein [Endomicrobium sp.]